MKRDVLFCLLIRKNSINFCSIGHEVGKEKAMNTMVNSSNVISPVFRSNSLKLSLEAVGLLLQMTNVPELDYCTIDDLYRMNPVSSVRKINRIIDELLDNKCLIKTDDNRLAVNKAVIAESMQVIHGNLLLRMEG